VGIMHRAASIGQKGTPRWTWWLPDRKALIATAIGIAPRCGSAAYNISYAI